MLQSIQEAGTLVRYKKVHATIENFAQVLAQKPVGLHFSGHGIENSKENFGAESVLLRDQGDYFLVLEDKTGAADLISEKMIRDMTESNRLQLEFVYMASCYSQNSGEIFLKSGAKHVICIRKG